MGCTTVWIGSKTQYEGGRDSRNYSPDFETLVRGAVQGKIRFLGKIQIDPHEAHYGVHLGSVRHEV